MILDEANRLFNRLLKHFTETIMHNAAGNSSSDPTLLLPQSSYSTFTNPYNQIHSHRIEESESVYISKDT